MLGSQAARLKRDSLLVLAAAGLLALAVLLLSPLLTKNTFFLLGLPFAGALVIVMFLSIRATFVLLLFSRALMDPLLNMTKLGGGAGIGGLLNLFVIFILVLYFFRFYQSFNGYRYLLPWGVFLGVCVLATGYSPLRVQGVKLVLNLTTYVCFFTAPFFLMKTQEDKKFWMKVLLFSTFLSVAYTDLCLALRHFDYDGRLLGAFTHPNILAFYLVFVVTLVFHLLETRLLKMNQMVWIFLWLYMLNVLVLLVFTQTRSAWISCAVMFFLYGVFKERKYLIVCLLGAMALAATPAVQSRLKDLGEGTGVRSTEKLNSMAWRMKLWESSVPMMLKRPVLGHGLVGFEYHSPEFFKQGKKELVHPHNVYVELMFNTGLVGLFSYLWIYARILKGLFRRLRGAAAAQAKELVIVIIYVLGYLLVCVSDNTLYYLAFNWYFWFYIGLVLKSFLPERVKEAPAVLTSA